MDADSKKINIFGDLENKATICRWGKTLMVDVVEENDKTVIVKYGVDPETNRPVLMKIHKIKHAYRPLTPDEARKMVADALSFARDNHVKETHDECATSKRG